MYCWPKKWSKNNFLLTKIFWKRWRRLEKQRMFQAWRIHFAVREQLPDRHLASGSRTRRHVTSIPTFDTRRIFRVNKTKVGWLARLQEQSSRQKTMLKKPQQEQFGANGQGMTIDDKRKEYRRKSRRCWEDERMGKRHRKGCWEMWGGWGMVWRFDGGWG